MSEEKEYVFNIQKSGQEQVEVVTKKESELTEIDIKLIAGEYIKIFDELPVLSRTIITEVIMKRPQKVLSLDEVDEIESKKRVEEYDKKHGKGKSK